MEKYNEYTSLSICCVLIVIALLPLTLCLKNLKEYDVKSHDLGGHYYVKLICPENLKRYSSRFDM